MADYTKSIEYARGMAVTRPRLLDLFCGAGGCSMGYYRAGFDVVGVDIKPQPRYPFEFHQADAMTWPLDGYDVVHASPPCQAYSITKHTHHRQHPDLLPATRSRLEEWGGVWVIENVPGAPMPGALVLCGSEFGLAAVDEDGTDLRLRRHRMFLSNVFLWGAGGCMCAEDRAKQRIAGAYAGARTDRWEARHVRRGGYAPRPPVRAELLGVPWMRGKEIDQAIPPAYAEHIGAQLLDHLRAAV